LKLNRIKDAFPSALTGPMARRSGGALTARLFGVGCGFLFAVAVARLLGPRGYGIVAVAISSATVVATVALLGANQLAVREVASFSARAEWSAVRPFVIWSVRTVAIASVAAALVMATASLLPGPYEKALLLGSAAVPLLALLLLMRGLIQGTGSVVAAQIPMDVVRWILTLLLIGWLFLGTSAVTPSIVILVVVIALGTSIAVSVVILARYLRALPRSEGSASNQPQWLTQSLPFLAIALFGILGTEIGTLLLGWLSGPREAGLYQPIAKLAPLMLLANEAVESALAPKIVHSWEQNDRQSLQRRVGRSALASALATTAIVAAIVIASPYILRAFGPEFIKYQWLIVWIGIAQVVNAATGAAPLLLAMTGDMKSRIGAQAVTMVVQLGLGLALIPAFGAPGAVASLVAAILVWSLLHWWLALRATGIDTSFLAIFSRRRRTA
jgi:O-antigen/teichoic acid export membrane protein